MTEIKHQGIITAIDDNRLSIKIRPGEACASCAIKDACGQNAQEKIVTAECKNPQDYQIGQEVETIITGRQLSEAAFFGYILPLVITLAVLFGVLAFTSDETCAAVAALLSVPVYYGILRYFGAKLHNMLKIKVQ